jgi:hypothetical protein
MTPAGLRGVENDALAIYFLDIVLANTFVTRWCMGYCVETIEGSARGRAHTPGCSQTASNPVTAGAF